MSSDNKIRKQFQSKFSNYKAPVPADGWERLEESLNQIAVARKAVVRRRWQYAGSAAAVLVLLLGGLLYINRPTVPEMPALTEAMPTTDEVATVVETETDLQIDLETFKDPLFADRSRSVGYGTVYSDLSIQPADPAYMFSNYIQGVSLENDKGLKRINPDLILYDTEYPFELVEESLIIEGDQNLIYADGVNGDDNNYILSFGSKGGLKSFHQTVNTPVTLRSAAVSNTVSSPEEPDKMLYKSNAIKDNIGEMEHSQPISFGVTVSKPIVNNLFIETGFVYSYLHSRSKNISTAAKNRETLSLHYLGVPLNLNYNIFSIKDLNVYVSLGGMLEKDVYGKYREEGESQSLDVQNMSEVLINETISQKNPQLSINAALGLSYPIYKDLKLYGKIGGAYYFDAKNLYPTIYSDSKIVMDLSLGVRYEF